MVVRHVKLLEDTSNAIWSQDLVKPMPWIWLCLKGQLNNFKALLHLTRKYRVGYCTYNDQLRWFLSSSFNARKGFKLQGNTQKNLQLIAWRLLVVYKMSNYILLKVQSQWSILSWNQHTFAPYKECYPWWMIIWHTISILTRN